MVLLSRRDLYSETENFLTDVFTWTRQDLKNFDWRIFGRDLCQNFSVSTNLTEIDFIFITLLLTSSSSVL